jgi:selenoprotein W-related protein
MSKVRITYCLPCRYQAKAVQDADALLKEFGSRIEKLELVPGEHGVYDVAVDDEVVYSIEQEHRFPEIGDLVERIRGKVSPGPQRRSA